MSPPVAVLSQNDVGVVVVVTDSSEFIEGVLDRCRVEEGVVLIGKLGIKDRSSSDDGCCSEHATRLRLVGEESSLDLVLELENLE